jgi:hypothetical protein
MAENPYLLEALCTHEVLRRLGFKAADIFFAASVPLVEAPESHKHLLGSVQMSVVLRTQCREFTITIGFFMDVKDREAIFAEWTSLVERFNREEGGKDKWEDIYAASEALRNAPGIALRLIERGFVLPKAMN